MKNETMQLLEHHFDTAFAAPDGIKRLRELILTLAMQGKLVPQDPKDPPAGELLKDIEREKRRLVGEGKIKKAKALPEITAAEVPYEVPDGWEWVRLGQITSKITDGDHKTPPRIPVGFRLLSAKNVRDGYLNFENCDCISEQHYLKSRERCCPETGDLLIVSVGGTIGRTSLVPHDSDFALVRSVALIKPLLMNSSYFKYAMDSNLLQDSIHAKKRGGAQPCLYLSEIEKFIFSLPPLSEQHRIVAKIDQLMARCEELEKLRAEREQKRLAIHSAVLKQLLEAQDQSSFADAWQFITRNFTELYSVKENVAELRKAILQLAVMGKLVPQDPNDPPASELLKEIEAEKRRLVKEGKIKKPKPLPEIKDDQVPCELPQGWVWARLGEIIELVSGQHLKPAEYNEEKIGLSYYTGPVDFTEYSPIATRWTTVTRAMAVRGDILLTVKGAGVGKINVLEEERAAISRQLMAVRVIGVNRDFVLRFFGTIFFELQSLAVGIAIPGIGREDVLLRKFPLPPLKEQHRIVAKIDQLMALCDTLDQQIAAATGKKTELLNSVMAAI